jgi:protein-S-isoprenylcysteine O-methyltransferase Ste14
LAGPLRARGRIALAEASRRPRGGPSARRYDQPVKDRTDDVRLAALRSALLGTVTMAALLFLPAGTLRYWQAWAFMAVFGAATVAITVDLALRDPQLLERRLHAGPRAEQETAQKIIMSVAMLGFASLLVVPAIDHRFGWSNVPASLSLIADALVALALLLCAFVLRANPYSASTIQIAEGQTVVSTGPYAIVRHPMYAAVIPLLVGMPVALGSWWGLAALILSVPSLVWRLLDEETFLRAKLPGYTEYARLVTYRLVPFVW